MAARKITLKFGLMAVAAQMETAVVTVPSMSNLCVGQPGHEAHDPSPLKMPKQCDTCGEIKDLTVLVKGVKAGQTYTIVDPTDLTEAKKEFNAQYLGVIDLIPHPAQDFLNATAPGQSLQYVTPADVKGADHYQLLVKLVSEHPQYVFAGLYTPVSKTALYCLQVRDGALVMQERVRDQAIKAAPSVGGVVNEALYAVLTSTLDQFVAPYDPEAYEDHYATAVAKMIETGDQITVDDAVTMVTGASDDALMAQLRALKEAAA